jgi:hypothetical protein
VSQEDYEEYKEGFEAAQEARERGVIEKHVDILMGQYSHKSDMWWRGFEDGKESNWDPPNEDEESEESE